jgi:hypothetical protein
MNKHDIWLLNIALNLCKDVNEKEFRLNINAHLHIPSRWPYSN